MGKMKLRILIGALGCFLCVGCGAGENIENNGNGLSEIENTGIEQEEAGELVSAAEFLDYYGMEEGVVSEDFLEEFIEHRQLTKEELSERNYDVMVKKLYERGVTFGSTVAELIAGERMKLSEDDDFSDVAYVVLQKDIYVDGTDMAASWIAVLEVENQKVYETEKNVTDDYTADGNVRELSKENIGDCLSGLRDMLTKDWDDYHSVEEKTYDWKLYIVKEDGGVISFSGEGPDEEFHPGFEKWCEDYLQTGIH